MDVGPNPFVRPGVHGRLPDRLGNDPVDDRDAQLPDGPFLAGRELAGRTELGERALELPATDRFTAARERRFQTTGRFGLACRCHG